MVSLNFFVYRCKTQVIIDGTGGDDHTFFVDHSAALENLTIQGSPADKYNLKLGKNISPTVNDCIIRNGNYAILLWGASATFNRCYVYGHTNTSFSVNITCDSDTGSSVFNYCVFENNKGRVRVHRAVSVTFNNSTFVGFEREAVTSAINNQNVVFNRA